MRLRRVDARTGGSVTVRSVLLRYAFGELWSALTASVYRPTDRRATERRQALQPQLEEIERQYPDDLDARQRAIQECYRANGVKPFGSCVWRLPWIPAPLIPALWSPHNQTMADRLAGTIAVVLEPRPPTPDNDRVQISVARKRR
jgi:membrane protein insertase Oxa1/YidC/SpoIIIJ